MTFSRPTIVQISGRLSLVGCRTTDKGTGTGAFVDIATDEHHIIADNVFLGWQLTVPASQTAMSVHNNTLTVGTGIQYPRGGERHMGAHVYRSASIGALTGIVTPIIFDTARSNTPGWYNGANPTRLTAGSDGWYLIGGCLEWQTGNTLGARYVILRLNGGTHIALAGGPVGGSTEMLSSTVTAAYYLSAGDYVEMCGYQTSGSTLLMMTVANRSPEFWLLRSSP